jgi:hypothetical protein
MSQLTLELMERSAEKGASLDTDNRLLPCLFVMGKGMRIRNFERQDMVIYKSNSTNRRSISRRR